MKPAFGARISDRPAKAAFDAPERWFEPRGRPTRVLAEPPGEGFVHPVTVNEVKARLAELPRGIREQVEVVQLSRMTRKRQLFPKYGLQWGAAVYLYPIEQSLVESYLQPPGPQQIVESRMYGGKWTEERGEWRLSWTPETLRDFYLNNILIHEVGHVVDTRNRQPRDRERFANWFAIEFGYRRSRRPAAM